MEDQKKREKHEELTKERKIEKEKNPRMPIEQGKKTKKRKKEGKFQDNWPKYVRENRGKSTR